MTDESYSVGTGSNGFNEKFQYDRLIDLDPSVLGESNNWTISLGLIPTNTGQLWS
ncbi:hypothetical protein PILCRDRAFT_821365 [Piloderma croceum F 1598]|uniref:Uncharacterized protein n=1 Tax=Piloderma croceum (strain F 1598) TaxID=765440 RepID=A0A0C3FAB3_PILCF|nr:hypothetical protein PILCRDRAFT_821365 [Piloderma croceum F 1598]